MGDNQSKQPKQQPQRDMMDVMLDMRMTAKKFEKESSKALKDKDVQIKKAKDALKKGNEEGAKLYLGNAAMKQKESLKYLQMSHKIEAISSQMKSAQNNQEMIQQLNKITPILSQQAESLPIEKLYGDMQNFEEAMDKMLVNNQVLNQTLNRNLTDNNQEIAVENMLDQLKQEYAAEVNGDLQSLDQFKQLNNNQQVQQNQNVNKNQKNVMSNI